MTTVSMRMNTQRDVYKRQMQFDAVVANPPFSAEWSAADQFNNDDRFSKAGRLAPKKTADYAFILHMVYHLNEGGRPFQPSG